MDKLELDKIIDRHESDAKMSTDIAFRKRREKQIDAAKIADWLEHPGAQVFLDYVDGLIKHESRYDIMKLDLTDENFKLNLLGQRLRVEILERLVLGYFKKAKQKAEQLIKEES